MTLNSISKYSSISITSLLLLSACGGGGGSSTTAPSALVSITAANAPQVSGAAIGASTGLQGVSSNTSNSLVGAVIKTGGNTDLIAAVIQQVRNAHNNINTSGSSVVGAIISDTIVCTSGLITFTFNDADNNQDVSTGDSLNMNANSCLDDGVTTHGGLNISSIVVSGDIESFPYNLGMTLTANKFSATENGDTVSMHGDITINSSTTNGINYIDTVSGSSIQVTETGTTHALRNFNMSSTDDLNTLEYTLDVTATVDSPLIGGSATIVTTTPFSGIGDNDPDSGQATITGADNTSVTLIALDAINVRLDIDEDGNGSIDSTTDTTWSNL